MSLVGDVRVLYYRRGVSADMMLLGHINKEDLAKTHKEVYITKEEIPEDRIQLLESYFSKFNSYETNPISYQNDKNKQKFISENKLHTSMSVGDVIEIIIPNNTVDDFNVETWVCSGIGWKKV